MARPAPPRARALNHVHHALVLGARGNFAAARDAVDTALDICRELPRPLPPVLELAGPIAVLLGDRAHEPMLRLAAEAADRWVRAFALNMLAHLAENDGEVDEQRRLLRAAHEEFRATGDRFGLGIVVHSLGELEDIAGEHQAAAQAYDESIALATELGNDDD